MLLLLWFIVLLFGCALIVDRILSEKQVQLWRETTRDMRQQVYNLDIHSAIASSHNLFCSLFDTVYGERYWSRKRLFRSYYSSILAVGIVAALIGWESTVFGRVGDPKILIGVTIAIFVLNAGADYLSLQETRWVLSLGRNPSIWRLGILLVVDLIATSIIWLAGFLVVGYLFSSVSGDTFKLEIPFIREAVFNVDRGLLFVLSTFFTSALWLIYMFSIAIIRTLKRNWRLIDFVLEAVGESHTPARATAGLISIFLVALYGMSLGINWVAGSIT